MCNKWWQGDDAEKLNEVGEAGGPTALKRERQSGAAH